MIDIYSLCFYLLKMIDSRCSKKGVLWDTLYLDLIIIWKENSFLLKLHSKSFLLPWLTQFCGNSHCAFPTNCPIIEQQKSSFVKIAVHRSLIRLPSPPHPKCMRNSNIVIYSYSYILVIVVLKTKMLFYGWAKVEIFLEVHSFSGTQPIFCAPL